MASLRTAIAPTGLNIIRRYSGNVPPKVAMLGSACGRRAIKEDCLCVCYYLVKYGSKSVGCFVYADDLDGFGLPT